MTRNPNAYLASKVAKWRQINAIKNFEVSNLTLTLYPRTQRQNLGSGEFSHFHGFLMKFKTSNRKKNRYQTCWKIFRYFIYSDIVSLRGGCVSLLWKILYHLHETFPSIPLKRYAKIFIFWPPNLKMAKNFRPRFS